MVNDGMNDTSAWHGQTWELLSVTEMSVAHTHMSDTEMVQLSCRLERLADLARQQYDTVVLW